jgi:isocitrate lyase
MTNHTNHFNNASSIPDMNTPNWDAINPEYVARMRMQNQFQTGIDIANIQLAIMRKDMDHMM